MNASVVTHKECITIVVPVYNRPLLIARCLDSLYGQTYRPLHVIVVDNASSDTTLESVKLWTNGKTSADFTLDILSERKAGAAYARQTGLEHVTTEKVMFFDSDDTMRPECVSTVMKAWAVRPSAEMVAWPVVVRHEAHPVITHPIKGDLLERHLVHAVMRTQGYAVKTWFLRKCGGWRGEFPVWNDFETGVRLLLRHPDVVALDVPLVDVYPQPESITGLSHSAKSGKWEKSLDGVDRVIEANGGAGIKRLHKIVSYRRAILAADYAKEGHPELAEPLYRQALSEVPKAKRPLIRFAYNWTRLGMRGAFSIIGKFL